MQTVPKLTVKSLGFGRDEISAKVKSAAQGQLHHLARIGGTVTGLIQKVNNLTGDVLTGLKGDFRGITHEGVSVASGVCYLPGGIQDQVEGAFVKAREGEGNERATITFAMDMFARHSTNPAGYEYVGASVQEVAPQSDPLLTMLLAPANGVTPTLAAPTATPALPTAGTNTQEPNGEGEGEAANADPAADAPKGGKK